MFYHLAQEKIQEGEEGGLVVLLPPERARSRIGQATIWKDERASLEGWLCLSLISSNCLDASLGKPNGFLVSSDFCFEMADRGRFKWP